MTGTATPPPLKHALVIGAGNGGKTTAADLALQGVAVRLFEFEQYAGNLQSLKENPVLECSGELQGTARLEAVVTHLDKQALEGVEWVFVCTVVQAHAAVARALAPFMTPRHILVLNPGSTGGALQFAHIWHDDCGMLAAEMPVLVELGTLTYGCRASGHKVNVSVKAKRVGYGTLPADAIERVGPPLEALFPGLARAPSVLAAGLQNANPIIHPAITLLNLGRMEKEGSKMLFYRDGVSPMVANLIQGLDEERCALLRALGYPAMTDPDNSVLQGYADSAESYYECYGRGTVYGTFASPNDGPEGRLAQHRYFTEDIGQGLVLYCSLGQALRVPTPTAAAVVHLAGVVTGTDYAKEQRRTVETLGLHGMSPKEIREYLATGRRKGKDGKDKEGSMRGFVGYLLGSKV